MHFKCLPHAAMTTDKYALLCRGRVARAHGRRMSQPQALDTLLEASVDHLERACTAAQGLGLSAHCDRHTSLTLQ